MTPENKELLNQLFISALSDLSEAQYELAMDRPHRIQKHFASVELLLKQARELMEAGK